MCVARAWDWIFLNSISKEKYFTHVHFLQHIKTTFFDLNFHNNYHWFCDLLFRFICFHTAAAAAFASVVSDSVWPHRRKPTRLPRPGILQARTLEWVAISLSNAWKWKVKVKSLSCARLLATPWTPAHQAPPSMGFSRQEYWRGVPLPSPVRYLIRA